MPSLRGVSLIRNSRGERNLIQPSNNAGTLKFKDNRDGTTSLHIHMSYNPPLGAIGHGVATTIGADLKTLLEEDLIRIKMVLEESIIPRDVQQRRSESSPMLKAEQLEM
jgi:uncharacterized membrane protein